MVNFCHKRGDFDQNPGNLPQLGPKRAFFLVVTVIDQYSSSFAPCNVDGKVFNFCLVGTSSAPSRDLGLCIWVSKVNHLFVSLFNRISFSK